MKHFTGPICVCVLAFALTTTGCTPAFGPKAVNGITFYCPGAGNIDFGDAGVRAGLEEAGYQGQVATLMWTVSFNPAIDQALRLNARLGGTRLARSIEQYVKEFPDRDVYLVGLSAGTGVAVWALEDLKDGIKVKNVVLLSSSLWHKYDVSEALEHVEGKIYVYYSPDDPILAGPMKVFGTIDGHFGEDGAGSVGLHTPRGAERVVNIPWRSEFKKYGYYGGHTDSTSKAFVKVELSPHIVNPGQPPSASSGETYAMLPAPAPPDVRRD